MASLLNKYELELDRDADKEEQWLLDIILSLAHSVPAAMALIDGMCSKLWLHRIVYVASKGPREGHKEDKEIQKRLNLFSKKGIIWV